MIFSEIKRHHPPLLCFPTGCIARTVSSPNQHLLRTDDVISCCLDLSAPSISFRINGQPVQGMFENFNIDGLFFPVVSFSAGIKLVSLFFGLFASSFLVLSQKTLYCHHTCFTNLLSWASVYRAFCPVANVPWRNKQLVPWRLEIRLIQEGNLRKLSALSIYPAV